MVLFLFLYHIFLLLLSFRFLISVILSVLTQRVSNIGPRNSLNMLLVLLSKDFIRKIVNPGLSEIILGKPKCPSVLGFQDKCCWQSVAVSIFPTTHTCYLWPVTTQHGVYAQLVTQSRPTPWDSMDYSPQGPPCLWDFSGKNTGESCYFLFQRIFLIQGSNLHLLHWQPYSLQLNHWEAPSPT